MATLAGILLVLAASAFILGPLLTGRTAPLKDGSDRLELLRELENLRDVTYETLRDLEFDHHAGKIADDDYRELRDRYHAEAIALVGRIAALEPEPPGAAPAAR